MPNSSSNSSNDQLLAEQKNNFLSSCHKTKKRISHSRKIFEEFEKKSSIEKKDLWKDFYEYKSVCDGEAEQILGKDIISSLRHHLVFLQGTRCCYCRRWLYNIAYARPIEHIVPRKSHPQFSMEYNNFAVACFDCNSIKNEANWENLNPNIDKYPDITQFSVSFHPRLHSYDEHISYQRIETNKHSQTVYFGKTPQGRHLCKFLLKKIAAMEVLQTAKPEIDEFIRTVLDFGETLESSNLSHVKLCIEEIHMRIRRRIETP